MHALGPGGRAAPAAGRLSRCTSGANLSACPNLGQPVTAWTHSAHTCSKAGAEVGHHDATGGAWGMTVMSIPQDLGLKQASPAAAGQLPPPLCGAATWLLLASCAACTDHTGSPDLVRFGMRCRNRGWEYGSSALAEWNLNSPSENKALCIHCSGSRQLRERQQHTACLLLPPRSRAGVLGESPARR